MRHKALAAVVLLVAIAGCDLFGGNKQNCSQPLPTPDVGRYVVQIDDGESCSTYSSGRARVSFVTVDRGLRPVVYFKFGSAGDTGIEIFMARQRNDSLSARENLPAQMYDIADLMDADPPYPGRFQTYAEPFSVSGWNGGGDIFFSRSGSVTIEAVQEEFVEGSFNVRLQWKGSSREMKAIGRFKAERERFGWLIFW
jgi:hypothetical protein